MLTPPPLAVGSRARFHAHFLGRALSYTYEVVELEPLRVFTMTTQEGPFPMTTTYRLTADGDERTKLELRNHGEPRGFGAIAAPLMAWAMRRANTSDLQCLAEVLAGTQAR